MTGKQREIRMQASRNAAIQFVGLALQNGIISLGSKKADQEENLANYVKAYADQFYAETVGVRDTSEDAVDVNQLVVEVDDDLAELS